MTDIQVNNLSVTLERTNVLKGVSFEVRAGTWTAIIGPNGSGKSTLLRALASVIPYDGDVVIDGTELRDVGQRHRVRHVAYAPQEPLFPPNMTVLEFVLLARAPYVGWFGTFTVDDHTCAHDAIGQLDLSPFADRRLGTLSGGERRRAGLAQVIAQAAPVVLLDEPTTALDVGHQQSVLELVDRLRRDNGLTVVTALHDLTLAAQYADQLIMLQSGRVVAGGAPTDVLTDAALAEHYGARVLVVPAGPGHIAVVPVRPGHEP